MRSAGFGGNSAGFASGALVLLPSLLASGGVVSAKARVVMAVQGEVAATRRPVDPRSCSLLDFLSKAAGSAAAHLWRCVNLQTLRVFATLKQGSRREAD